MNIGDIARIVAAGGVVDLLDARDLQLGDLIGIARASDGRGGLIFDAGGRKSDDIIAVVNAAPGRVQVRIALERGPPRRAAK